MHPGMASNGHPAGMVPNPQHMGQPMMHPASGPGGQPHVSQAGALMGMQQPGTSGPMAAMQGGVQHPGGMPGQPGQTMPGAAPNAHALSQQQMLHQMQSESLLLFKIFGRVGVFCASVALVMKDLTLPAYEGNTAKSMR